MERLIRLGADHERAELRDLGALTPSPEDAEALLKEWDRRGGGEACILATCNRVEFYLVGGDATAEEWLAAYARRLPAARAAFGRLERLEDEAAARHLLRTTCGLSSAVLGDGQIPGQVKESFKRAQRCGTLGPVLGALMRSALAASRDARAGTGIASGELGLGSSLLKEMSERGLPDTGLEVLIVGAGQAAREVALTLSKRGAGRITVVNRTYETARDLAARCAGRALPWSDLREAAVRSDLIVAAVSGRDPVLVEEDFARRRPGLVVADLGVPRNLRAPRGVVSILNEELSQRRDAALERRREAVPAVERVVEAELARWKSWRSMRAFDGVLRDLFASEELWRRAGLAPELFRHARALRRAAAGLAG